MSNRRLPVSAPALVGNERKYVLDCVDSNWISSGGEYVARFERKFAESCGARHAVACCNGTAALHLALLALGVKENDEVIVPTLTFVATANAVTYCNARLVFVDSEAATWNIDPQQIESKITARTRAIIAVHLFGHPAEMDAIRRIARKHNLFVIEDAAEAHAAIYRHRTAGNLADLAAFSFYGNKIISTGEGGMVTTNDDTLAARVRQLHGQGYDSQRRYWFPVIGYNYRMTNLCAAIGLAQIENLDWHIARRHEVAAWYKEFLDDSPFVLRQREQPHARHAYWIFAVTLTDRVRLSRDEVAAKLADEGIETRPVFYPMHTLPPYAHLAASGDFPVAEKLAERGLCLPTWAGLTRDDVAFICDKLEKIIK